MYETLEEQMLDQLKDYKRVDLILSKKVCSLIEGYNNIDFYFLVDSNRFMIGILEDNKNSRKFNDFNGLNIELIKKIYSKIYRIIKIIIKMKKPFKIHAEKEDLEILKMDSNFTDLSADEQVAYMKELIKHWSNIQSIDYMSKEDILKGLSIIAGKSDDNE